ncbi:MAG TPA: hypothetical protein PKA64_00060 [Myxococcota bacterium]|nr:hypothetical protein [Myxococcota bacterium]
MRAPALLLLLPACTSAVKNEFQATYTEIMRPPPPLSRAWEPDVSVRMAPRLVESALTAALDGAKLSTIIDLPGIKLEPSLSVDALRLVDPTLPCDGCLGVVATLAGNLDYRGFGYAGRTRARVHLGIDTSLQARQEPDGWVVVAAPPTITSIETDLPSMNRTLSDWVLSPLARWVSSTITQDLAPITLARLGRLDLPIQALRVSVVDAIVELEARTTSPDPRPVEPAPDPGDGWAARMASASVVSTARLASFQQGSLGLGVWAEPRDIDVDDDRLVVDLRVWRVAGMGWWRDYHIDTQMSLEGGRLTLEPREVTEAAHSQGAGLADPIAALLRGRILEVMASAVNTSVPSSRTQDIGGTRSTWSIDTLEREIDDLVITGSAQFESIVP